MKKSAFTLIELIFSMVIIAIAFSVLPKIMQMATKVSTQSVREESMYAAVALMGLIQSTAWDEKNTEYDDILLVDDGDSDYECSINSTDDYYHYRIGGFKGSRNCKNEVKASDLADNDSNDGDYKDDMDDFDAVIASNYNDSREYNLTVSVAYVKDIEESNGSAFTVDEPSDTTDSTNTKYIVIEDKSKKKANVLRNTIVKLSFHAMNIGQIQINRRAW